MMKKECLPLFVNPQQCDFVAFRIIQFQDLSSNAKIVYLYLYNLYNVEKGYSWPSIETIAKKLGLSISTIHIALNELVHYKLIFIEKICYDDKKKWKRKNVYYFPNHSIYWWDSEDWLEQQEILEIEKNQKGIHSDPFAD